MRKLTVLVSSLLVCGAVAMAQMEPEHVAAQKTELFVGYSYQYAGTSGSDLANLGGLNVNSTNLNGFAFDFSHYVRGSLGYMVDFSRGSHRDLDSTGTKYSRTTYMAGPTYRLHSYPLFTPSVHVLAGVDRDDFTVPNSSGPNNFDLRGTYFAAAAGATVDGNLSPHVAIRLAQVDYLYTRNWGSNQTSFRYAAGIVMRF
jgi:hypothetical protein